MNSLGINFDSRVLIFGLPILIILTATALALSSLTKIYPELAIGITYDLVLSAPLLYLFLIRKQNISKLTAVPFFTGGIILATFLLPGEQQFHLNLVKTWLLPVIEVGVIGYIGFSAYKSYKTYQSLSKNNLDVLRVLRETSQKIVFSPIAANILAFEIAVAFYGFISWKKRRVENAFTYHKNNGIVALISVAMFLILAETFVVHILLANLSIIAAWVLTISSFYVAVQLFAHLKATFQRPIEVSESKIFLRYGLFGDAEIDLENIAEIQITSEPFVKAEGVKKLALLGELEQHNIKVCLKNEAILTGFYGTKKRFKTLLFFVDEAENFKRLVEQQKEKN